MEVFTLKITKCRPTQFGETKEAERAIIVQALHDAAQIVGSHRAPEPLRYDGTPIGEYQFGPASLNKD
jgi:hypothetical protein